MFRDTIIYIVCPANRKSGGPELLHQLASFLISQGMRAYMLYVPQDVPDPVHGEYNKYHVPFVRRMEDSPKNLMIVPETSVNALPFGKHIRRVFWWLSVDNWLLTVENTVYPLLRSVVEDTGPVLLAEPMPTFFWFPGDARIEHWVQSEYARRFVEMNGIPADRVRFVGDYLNPVFLRQNQETPFSDKKDIIVYNPEKGLEFTQKLIRASAHDLCWQAIKGMTSAEVAALLRRAKIYIDFGHHPGRDRLPREAAASGCCVLTSKKGSAANDVDIPIGTEYKFEDKDENIEAILSTIRYILRNFEKEAHKQESYRRSLFSEQRKFQNDVRAALAIPSKDFFNVAVLMSGSLGESVLPLLQAMTELKTVFFVDDMRAGEMVGAGDIGIPVVSLKDAAFLYRERRIDRFLYRAEDNREEEALSRRLDAMEISGDDRWKL